MSSIINMNVGQTLDAERSLADATRNRLNLHRDLEDLFHQVGGNGGNYAKDLNEALEALEALTGVFDMLWDEITARQEELELETQYEEAEELITA